MLPINRRTTAFPYRPSAPAVGQAFHSPNETNLQGRFVSPDSNVVTGIFDEFVTADEDDSNDWIPGKHANILSSSVCYYEDTSVDMMVGVK